MGRETGLPVQVSHLGPFGVKNGGKIAIALGMMEKAREEGVDIAYDSLAYCGSDTLAIALFPPAAYAEGIEKFLRDTKDPEMLTFGLLLARFAWPENAGEILTPFFASRNPLERRAALYALARNDAKLFSG